MVVSGDIAIVLDASSGRVRMPERSVAREDANSALYLGKWYN